VLRSSGSPGRLSIAEGVDGDWVPVEAEVAVGGGERLMGGERPQSWRPDRPVDEAVYRATLCPPDGEPSPAGPSDGCAQVERSFRWAR